MKKKSDNLIVIIGNGFDLAHKLETGFSHFAEYYKNIIINNLKSLTEKETNNLSDIFFHFYNSPTYYQNELSYNKEEKTELFILVNLIKNGDEKEIEVIINKNIDWILSFILKNKFLGKLYSNSYSNWFDIEQAYYFELCEILKSSYNHKEKLKELNINFEEIKKVFKNYLSNEIYSIRDNKIHYSIGKHFSKRKNITIVNFNYTDTISHYLNFTHRITNIHIHNKLDEDIIFGYGDDTDENYKKMKDSKEKEYLRNFKTFNYLVSTNNRKVLNELSVKDNYDVLVIGHSLDTTDKTILKKILDTNKCDYIELLKRSDLENEEEKKEAHFELHANLARIFDSESDLREKLIPFEWSVNFPIMTQIDENIIIKRNKELYLKKRTRAFTTVNN